jgi:hypothetical protein
MLFSARQTNALPIFYAHLAWAANRAPSGRVTRTFLHHHMLTTPSSSDQCLYTEVDWVIVQVQRLWVSYLICHNIADLLSCHLFIQLMFYCKFSIIRNVLMFHYLLFANLLRREFIMPHKFDNFSQYISNSYKQTAAWALYSKSRKYIHDRFCFLDYLLEE